MLYGHGQSPSLSPPWLARYQTAPATSMVPSTFTGTCCALFGSWFGVCEEVAHPVIAAAKHKVTSVLFVVILSSQLELRMSALAAAGRRIGAHDRVPGGSSNRLAFPARSVSPTVHVQHRRSAPQEESLTGGQLPTPTTLLLGSG